MAWITATPNLTAVIAHDALRRESNGNLTDLTGNNNHAATNGQPTEVCTGGTLKTLYAVKGTGLSLPYTGPVTLPASGVIFAVIKTRTAVILANNSADVWLCAIDTSQNKIYQNNSTNTAALSSTGSFTSIGVAYGPNYQRFFQNNNWLQDAQVLSILPAVSLGMTYPGWGLNGDLVSWGIFSGSPGLEDIEALDVASKLDMTGPDISFRGLAPIHYHTDASTDIIRPGMSLGELYKTYGNPTNTTSVNKGFRNDTAHTVIFNGDGYLEGSVKSYIGTELFPAYCRLVLIDEQTRFIFREMWNDPDTGFYRFEGIDTRRPYTILAYDATGFFLSVTANRRYAVRQE